MKSQAGGEGYGLERDIAVWAKPIARPRAKPRVKPIGQALRAVGLAIGLNERMTMGSAPQLSEGTGLRAWVIAASWASFEQGHCCT
jgi:hypothetical protein